MRSVGVSSWEESTELFMMESNIRVMAVVLVVVLTGRSRHRGLRVFSC